MADQTQRNFPSDYGCSQARDTRKITEELPLSTKAHLVHCQLTLESESQISTPLLRRVARGRHAKETSNSCPIILRFHSLQPPVRPTDRLKMGETWPSKKMLAETVPKGRVYRFPFHPLLQIKVPHRNSVPCSLSPDGPNGRAHMKKDLPATVSVNMDTS